MFSGCFRLSYSRYLIGDALLSTSCKMTSGVLHKEKRLMSFHMHPLVQRPMVHQLHLLKKEHHYLYCLLLSTLRRHQQNYCSRPVLSYEPDAAHSCLPLSLISLFPGILLHGQVNAAQLRRWALAHFHVCVALRTDETEQPFLTERHIKRVCYKQPVHSIVVADMALHRDG